MKKLPLLVFLVLTMISGTTAAGNGTSAKKPKYIMITIEKQMELIHNASQQCITKILKDPDPKDGVYCGIAWDDIMCWPYTKAGVMAKQRCPKYINGFADTDAYATRQCTENGTWFIHSEHNKTWTNFSECYVGHRIPTESTFRVSKIIIDHIDRLQLMYNTGYGLSLVSLVIAIIIMLYFKKLHCQRNTVHINLFLSFSLRAAVSIFKDNAMENGAFFPNDFHINPYGRRVFNPNISHWECKLLFSILHYSLAANYMWIFVEALYLHMLIFVSVFSDRHGIKWYVVIGWLSPLLFVVPWIIVRATLDNTFCWNTHPQPNYFWITKTPILITILVNFLLFLNIVRVLFTKMNTPSSTPEARRYRYRKLGKSTLVLVPLFGVHYIIFVAVPDEIGKHSDDNNFEIGRLYFEMFFNSFQGFIVAILYCFCNGEVQAEIRKTWQRYRLMRGGGSLHCSTSRGAPSRYDTQTSVMTRNNRNSTYSIGSEKLENGQNGSTKNESPSNKKKGPFSFLKNGSPPKGKSTNGASTLISKIPTDTTKCETESLMKTESVL
ncbi:unnamed protein product [Owenia fusiformis]|uniref:Uncharacterized protein n=2 Tax=Owenia fusiformis TaxID=6347 RepID=A0A8J1XRQ0_OWEFU|nr:unnamed protein product [Owenia fusiformis]